MAPRARSQVAAARSRVRVCVRGCACSTMTDEVGRGEWRNSTESPGLGWAGAASPSRPLADQSASLSLWLAGERSGLCPTRMET